MSGAAVATDNWDEANHKYLAAELRRLHDGLAPPELEPGAIGDPNAAPNWSHGREPALEQIVRLFSLTPFERGVLLLCAGVELEARFRALCASLGNTSGVTFSLALATLPGAHWDAASPERPLRFWNLLRFDATLTPLTQSELKIDERILHFLVGVPDLDRQLAMRVRPIPFDGVLSPSLLETAHDLSLEWSRQTEQRWPVLQINGTDYDTRAAIAAEACRSHGLQLLRLSTLDLPEGAEATEELRRAMLREAALGETAWLIENSPNSTSPETELPRLSRLIDAGAGPVILSSEMPMGPFQRETQRYEVTWPDAEEQYQLWEMALGADLPRVADSVPRLVSHFNLTAGAIAACARAARESGSEDPGRDLWRRCRAKARPRTDGLAQRVHSKTQLADLILPKEPKEMLERLVQRMAGREQVLRRWGFASRGSRGLGTSALFAGPSGTGKTMAAEAIASALDLDLYRVDISAIMDKYVGETEKNLRRVFDAAEAGGVVLLFDEADALFGKRSEVKDSHDRFANLEVSYLLQRLETYQGLALLTTNLEDGIDAAFLRRIQTVVRFPFPGPSERQQIWKEAFPNETPTAPLDTAKLSRLHATGATIHNIALDAAFRAAEAGTSVHMGHLLDSAKAEMAKLGRPLTLSETRDWA